MMSGIKLKSLKTSCTLVAISVVFLCKLVGTAMAYEEPKYELIKSTAIYEIRKYSCLLYTSPSPRDLVLSRMPSSA